VLGRLKREGKGITQQAYQSFIDKTGTDMENIDRELEKLICYTLDKDVIEPSDVAAVTTEQTQNKIFEMVDAISSHQQKKALDLYYDLLALREPSMRILYLITRQFHLLAIVKAMGNQGFGNRDIAAKAGCPEWAVRKYQAQCRGFSLEQLRRAVEDGTEYEEAVKTGRLDDQMAVELFIVQYSARQTA
jgi:DNA polymerase-3 subunit delta